MENPPRIRFAGVSNIDGLLKIAGDGDDVRREADGQKAVLFEDYPGHLTAVSVTDGDEVYWRLLSSNAVLTQGYSDLEGLDDWLNVNIVHLPDRFGLVMAIFEPASFATVAAKN